MPLIFISLKINRISPSEIPDIVSVNVEHIQFFRSVHTGRGGSSVMVAGTALYVEESSDEIKARITAATDTRRAVMGARFD